MSISMKDLLAAGVHFGHRTPRWNPKMKHYLYGKRGGIHIFDLEQTANQLNEALAFLYDQASVGKTILFVSTKNQTSTILPEAAKAANIPYLANRWPGGFLTNFRTIKERIKYLISLEENKQSGELTRKYTKKEALMFERDIVKLNEVLEGVKPLKNLPDVVVVFDAVRDQLAIAEAFKMKIPVIALCDSNADPSKVKIVIPGNDDALRSLTLMVNAAAQAVAEGRKAYTPSVRESRDQRPAASASVKPIDKLDISAAVMSEKDEGEKAAVAPRAPVAKKADVS